MLNDFKQGKEIDTYPNGFTKWVEKNQSKIASSKSLPYFVKYNKDAVKEVLTKEEPKEKSNIQSVADAVGVEVGKPMTFEEADEKHPNPHFEEDEQYRVNCQSAVVAYEMRRRGLPVEAFGRVENSMGEQLAYNTTAAWVDANGKMPTRIVSKYAIKERTIDKRGYVHNKYTTSDEVLNDFLSQTSEVGRYHVSWRWNGGNKGHIITMETFADGSRLFYDPQTGLMAKNIIPWAGKKMSKIDLQTRGLCAYRVDNLQPNPLVVKGVIKKAGSMAATPMASSEQLRWWGENVTNNSTNGVNGSFKKLNDWHKEVRKSSRLEIKDVCSSTNLETGHIRRNGCVRNNLIQHIRNEEELQAADYIWNNPHSLKFVRHSPLGEVKDMTNPKDIKNIESKKERFVTSYNVYELNYNGAVWEVKVEVYKNKAEQIYNIKKK